MATITIPKKLIKNELVVIPRKDYEQFLTWQKAMESFKIFTPTAAQKKALLKARENRKKGNFLTLDELKRKLDFTN